MKKYALILAGGIGSRMNCQIPKQFMLLNKLPILMHTIKKFNDADSSFNIVLVLPKNQEMISKWKKLCEKHKFYLDHDIVCGGETRFHSVKEGLKKIEDNSVIAIHDGVRPLVSKKLINQSINLVNTTGVIPCVKITDSIRKKTKQTSFSIKRDDFFAIQTPQCFNTKEIKNAYSQKYNIQFTDDATVFERYGGKIKLIDGEKENIKITTAFDLRLAEYFIK